MVPVFVLVYFSGDEAASRYWALAVYVIAQGTDVLDGYIARKYNLITRLGRVLDPLADKLMTFTVAVCLVIRFEFLWWAAAILFVKESLMGIGALVQYKKITEVPPSNLVGKVTTVYFYLLLISMLLLDDLIPPLAMNLMFAVAVVLTLTAFIIYVNMFNKNLKQAGKSTEE